MCSYIYTSTHLVARPEGVVASPDQSLPRPPRGPPRTHEGSAPEIIPMGTPGQRKRRQPVGRQRHLPRPERRAKRSARETSACFPVHIYVYVSYLYVCHLFIYVFTYTCIYLYVYTYVQFVYTYICVNIYIYIYLSYRGWPRSG